MSRPLRTDNAIEEADADDGSNRPEGVPEEDVRVLEDTAQHTMPVSMAQFRDAAGMTSEYLLLTAPTAVDLEPPKYADTQGILVEEVHDPASREQMSAPKPHGTPRSSTHMLPLRA